MTVASTGLFVRWALGSGGGGLLNKVSLNKASRGRDTGSHWEPLVAVGAGDVPDVAHSSADPCVIASEGGRNLREILRQEGEHSSLSVEDQERR